MKKQLQKSIFRAVLLLLSLVCLALLISSVVMAETSPTLKLNFIAADVRSCEVKVNGSVVKTLTPDDNAAISIPLNAEVEVTIVAQTGRQVASLSVQTGTAVDLQNNKTIAWKNFTASYEATINCEPRKYPIKLLNYNRDEVWQYTAVLGDEALLTALGDGLTYQAGGTENIYLPDVEMPGYTFHGWRIKTGPGETDFQPASHTTEGETTVWYLGTALSHNHFDELNAIYIYPEMKPINAITYREDRIYDETGTETLLSFPADSAIREIDSQYSAIMQWGDEVNTGYKSYPGYQIMLNEEYAQIFGTGYPMATVKPTDVDPDYNTVTRYYKPIEYTLVYLDDDGSSLRDSGTYLYGGGNSGIPTNVAQPTRQGYTFVGWTVEVWRGGAWVKVMHTGDQNPDKNAEGEWLYPNVSKPDLVLGDKNVNFENGRTDGNAIYASEKGENGEYEIRLTANWKANSYSIEYLWGLPADASDDLMAWMESADANLALKNHTAFTFATPLSIPSPVRPGHSFAGWTVRYAEKGTDEWKPATGLLLVPGADGTTALPTGSYAYDLELTATWKANRYTVELDPAGGVSGDVTQLEEVVYGAPLTITGGDALLPNREGYTFEGFYSRPNGEGVQYITREGAATDAIWIEEGESGAAVLYAHWVIIKSNDIYTLTQNDGDITVLVESLMGLHPDTTLTLVNETDFEALAKKILEAIRTPGKITVEGFMTVAEAEQALRELDVFAFYRVEMRLVEPIKQGEVFTVTLRLSDALKGRTGLQVVYYDEETGTVEVLETETQGDYLIFRADRLASFVVMADPILDLTPVIILLGSILLLQIIALAILLTMRTRAKQSATLASVAFPAIALTIRFMPVGGEWIALIMAAAVVILQVVLMLLLFRSGFIYQPRRKEDEAGETAPEAPADEAPADEAPAAEAFAYVKTETDVATETAVGETDFGYDETDPFAIYDTDVEDVEDFIEPAATTRYSLPEDGEAFAYADDEDGDALEEFLEDADAEGDAFAYADEEAYADEDLIDEDGAAEYDASAYVDDAYFASEAPAEEVVYVDENGEIIEDYAEETDEASEDDLYRYDE